MGPPTNREKQLPRLEMLGISVKKMPPPKSPPKPAEKKDEPDGETKPPPPKKKAPAKETNGGGLNALNLDTGDIGGGDGDSKGDSKGMWKATPAMLGYVPATDHCSNCKYMTEKSTCSNMSDFPVSPDDGCHHGFESKSAGNEEETESPEETASEPEAEPVGAAY